MLVVDLACTQGHRFEGWFASADDLASQQARGLVSCPVCGDLHVQRVPSAPRLNVSHLTHGADASAGDIRPGGSSAASRSPDASGGTVVPGGVVDGEPSPSAPVGSADAAQALQALYWSAVRHVIQHTEDVGERFASEARAMHSGELPAKPIRGQLDDKEREALQEEGIEVLTLIVPKGMDGPVQ